MTRSSSTLSVPKRVVTISMRTPFLSSPFRANRKSGGTGKTLRRRKAQPSFSERHTSPAHRAAIHQRKIQDSSGGLQARLQRGLQRLKAADRAGEVGVLQI